MKKVLVLGDYEKAIYHPLRGVDEQLKSILSDCEVTACVAYTELKLEDLNRYDMVINYIDAWKETGCPALSALLLGFVAAGGKLMTIHNGIITHQSPDIEQMQGGAFLRHPERCDLTYSPAGEHPIVKDFKPFTVNEEPYQFVIDEGAKAELILNYAYQGGVYPAAWVRPFGLGQVVYLSPGHEAASFMCEGFRELIRRSAAWLMQ